MTRKYKGMSFIQEVIPKDGCKYWMAIHYHRHELIEPRFTIIGQKSIKNMKRYINWLLSVGLYIENIREISNQYCIKYENN